MKFKKYNLNILERIRCIWDGIRGLSQSYILVTGKDIPTHYEYHSWSERFETLLIELETALLGYVWELIMEDD